MTFLIVRHGQTRFNLENRIQGRLDSPLTLRGIEESRTAAATIRKIARNEPEHLLFASPQGRAVETMEIVRQHLGLTSPVQLDERLAEVGLGSWEGRTYGECVNADTRELPVSDIATAWALSCPLGETLDSAIDRTDRFVRSHGGVNAIIVTHAIIGRLLIGRCRRWSLVQALAFDFKNGQVEWCEN